VAKVSIVVTSYNYEQYIGETLTSIVNQTFKDFEVIIVDDGSKDNSVAIINEFVQKYPNFKLYTHENNQNKGLIESLKLALSKVNSEYVAFLESDDYWTENYLQEKFDCINQNPKSVIIINDIQTIGSSVDDIHVENARKYFTKHNSVKNHFKRFYRMNSILTFSIVMIKTDVIKSLDFNSVVPAFLDWWLWRQLAIQYPIEYIDKKLTYWRRHNTSYMVDFRENIEHENNLKKASNLLLLKKFPFKMCPFIFMEFVKSCAKGIFSLGTEYRNGKLYKTVRIIGFRFAFDKK
jgi:glycosyltransferase involved in cell wall biosynthesis